MADRIAVMNAGRIDQLAAPSEIYDRPATPFVADFIGDMNHLEGTLERDGDKLVAAVGEARFGIGRVVARGAGRRARPDRPAARGGARQHARRGHAGHVPDRDGARPQPADRRRAGDGRGARRPASAAPATSAWARSAPATSCGSAGARPPRCCSGPRTARAPRAAPARTAGMNYERKRPDARPTRRAEHPGPRDQARGVRAHDHPAPGAARRRRRGDGRVPRRLRRLDRRAAAAEAAAAAAARRTRRPSRRRRPTARSRTATCCWRTGSTTPIPPTTRPTRRSTARRSRSSGFGSNDEILAKLRAGGSKYDVISPTGYAVKTMADLGLIMPLTHELIPNLKNLSPAFTKTDYDPGNKYSVPKDYGITSFYWLTDKVSESPKTIARVLRPAQDAAVQGHARQLPRGRHAGHGAGARGARLLDQHRGPGRGRRGQAAAGRRQAERRHGQLDVHRARHARRDRLRHGLERRHPARDRRARQEGPRDGLPRARGPDRVLGRQLGHPDRRRAPGRRAQVDRLRPRPGQRGQGDELPPVPGAGDRDQGRRSEARVRPRGQHPGRQDPGLRVDVETAKSLQQRNRAYTEFKAA